MSSSFLDLFQDKGYGAVVEKLVEERRKVKIEPKEKDKEKEQFKVNVLDELSKDFEDLRKFATRLYGFDSAFKKRSFLSDDESILTGTASPKAKAGSYEVEVVQLAQRHRLSSDPLKLAEDIPPGDFVLRVGEKELSFKFKGGDLYDFAKLFRHPAKKEYFDISVIKQDSEYAILVLGSNEEGEVGRIRLIKDSTGLLSKIGVFQSNTASNVSIFKQKPPRPSLPQNTFTDETLTLSPGTKEKILVNIPVLLQSEKLGLNVSWQKYSVEEMNAKRLGVMNWDLQLPTSATISLEGNHLISSLLLPFDRGRNEPGPIKKKIETVETDPLAFKLTWNVSGALQVHEYVLPEGFKASDGSMRFNIQPPGAEAILTMVEFINNNSHHSLSFSDFIKEVESDEDMVGKNELDAPQNSVVEYKGVQAKRDSNQVEDLIDGVTLNLNGKGETKFVVDRDRKFMEEQLINFLGQFNICVGKLNTLMSSEEPPVDAEEKEKKRYGLFSTDFSIRSLRQKMSRIVENPHPTSDVKTLTMLVQLGINSTFIRGNPFSQESKKLDLSDENKFDKMFEDHPDLVGELFGYDNNGDLIIESGVAFEIGQLALAYIQNGGSFESSKATAKTRIKGFERTIDREEERLEDQRMKWVKEFSRLTSVQEQMKKMQQMMKGFEQ